MESSQQQGVMSGASTPDYPKTPKTTSSVGRGLRRSDSQETLLTSITEVESILSTPSLDYPNPPLNSPLTRSEVGDREVPSADSLADKLQSMPANLAEVTPPASVSDGEPSDDEGKPLSYYGVATQDFATFYDPPRGVEWRVKMLTPKRVERFERIPRSKRERDTTPTPAKMMRGAAYDVSSTNGGSAGVYTPPTSGLKGYPEYNTWVEMAEEDVTASLKRLAMAAKDEHKINPGKSVEQCYSERLARLIRSAEIGFDVKVLQ